MRLVVPWKYGFKGDQVDREDPLHRAAAADDLESTPRPNEYGFYANVNPDGRSSALEPGHERRIGEFGRRPTLTFNGYAEQVAELYAGMDLKKNF